METFGKITLHNGDCMDVLKSLPDNAFDLAIIDPPYGINISKKTTLGKRGGISITNYNKKCWDNSTPSKYYFWELKRVSKNYIIFGANYFLDKINLHNHSWIIWDKKQPEGISFAMGEIACYSGNKPVQIYRHTHDGNRVCNNIRKATPKIHPTQKPASLYAWILKNYAKEGDKILDTHLGSGSICIAAHDLGFEMLGIELDEEYYNSARKRLVEHQKQLNLFL